LSQPSDRRLKVLLRILSYVYSVLGIVHRPILKERRKNYGNEISYPQVSGREALKLIFGLGRAIFNPRISMLLIYMDALRINFLRRRKLKI
jgi:hypothetical protein